MHSLDEVPDDTIAKLMSLHQVIITGHQAFLITEALRNIATTTLYNLECLQQGIDNGNLLAKRCG